MIAEVLIASIAAVTIAGTWLGLRFVDQQPSADNREVRALRLVRAAVQSGSPFSEEGRALSALLMTDPEALPSAVRERAAAWLSGRPWNVEVER